MLSCPKCSRPVSEHSNFCVYCYAPIVHTKTESRPVPSKPMLVVTPGVCPSCSASLDEDSKFCPSCRTPVTFTNLVDCPECGKSINADAKFCKYCAADLTSKKNTSNRRKSKSAAAGNLIVFGAIIATVSALAYLWGVNYASNFRNVMSAGFSNMMGRSDATYDMAVLAVNFGPISFFAGLIMFIVGIVLKNK
jgi:RNA polymerase subunit RPABC4/transcription elongation factor Spt4